MSGLKTNRDFRKHISYLLLACICLSVSTGTTWMGLENVVWAQAHEDEDIQNADVEIAPSDESSTSAETLLEQAQDLFIASRPIDARAKLMKALALDPENYKTNMMLGQYYLSEVGHFRMAQRYLSKAMKSFESKHSGDPEQLLQTDSWREHARLLTLQSETELNLDKYEAALATLNRFGEYYWDPSLSASKAWVLMKLGRIDEAIKEAQKGLLRGDSAGRTFNVLGILLSVKGNRELSIKAFAQALLAEKSLGQFGQMATPLNNVGEVYRELFRDRYGEAAWKRAISLHDGCDHVLPSLNLAILYVDELRLNQAERVLDDFEACFSAQGTRSDTEHRALLALLRGRIALHMGKIDRAIELLERSHNDRQWFGKIGTTMGDAQLAAKISLAQALRTKAAIISREPSGSLWSDSKNAFLSLAYKTRAWLLGSEAIDIGLTDLKNFEDMYVRHTDAMIEYPTLHRTLSMLPEGALRRRISRLSQEDSRSGAHLYYQLYLASNLLEHGSVKEAMEILSALDNAWRTIDRLARVEQRILLVRALYESNSFWVSSEDSEQIATTERKIREQIFVESPPALRNDGLTLPISLELKVGSENPLYSWASSLADLLTSSNFEKTIPRAGEQNRFHLSISPRKENSLLDVSLLDRARNSLVTTLSVSDFQGGREDILSAAQRFIDAAFAHTKDPDSEALPALLDLE